MKYTRENTIQRYNSGENLKFLFFWGHQPSKDGSIISSCFSQWWESDFNVSDITYKTAEHYMMAEKARLFEDEKTLKEITDDYIARFFVYSRKDTVLEPLTQQESMLLFRYVMLGYNDIQQSNSLTLYKTLKIETIRKYKANIRKKLNVREDSEFGGQVVRAIVQHLLDNQL